MGANIKKYQQPIRVGSAASAPAGSQQGTIYWDTNLGALRVHDGSQYDSLADYTRLASQTTGDGASLIGIEDDADYFTATTVEAALAEVYELASAGGTSEFLDNAFKIKDSASPTKVLVFEATGITAGQTRTITMPDEDVDLGDMAKETVLASVSNGQGASLIGIEDAVNQFTATTVEAALAESLDAAQAAQADATQALADASAAQADATQALADAAAAQGDIDAHLDGTASKHDATEIDFEYADGSKKNIQAASDDVELALRDLDTAIGSLDATPDNYTASSPAIVASHLAGIDSKLGTLSSTISNFEWQPSVKDADVLTPPGTPTIGDRYLIDGVGAGGWTGKDNQIAEWNGAWVYTLPTVGMFVAADDEPSILYLYGGTSWSAKAFESTTASTGLTKVGFDVRLDSSSAGSGLGFSAGVLSVNVDGQGLEITADSLGLELDGSTLSKSASGLKVNSIANAQVAALAAIDLNKLAAMTGDLALVSDGSGFISESTVTATELGYLSGVTSAIQTQLGNKLENVVEDLTPQLGGPLDLNGQTLTGMLRLGDSGSPTRFVEHDYIDAITLTASTTDVASALTFDSRSVKGIKVVYTIVDGDDRRIGELSVVCDQEATTAATDHSLVDTFNETTDIGVSWAAGINGNNIELSYTTDAGAGNRTMRAEVIRYLA